MKENPKTLNNTGLAPTSPPIVSASPKESGTTSPVVPDANVDLKLYKSLQGHQIIMSWYEQLKNEIEVDHESLFVETRFGQTHAIVAGDINHTVLQPIANFSEMAVRMAHEEVTSGSAQMLKNNLLIVYWLMLAMLLNAEFSVVIFN